MKKTCKSCRNGIRFTEKGTCGCGRCRECGRLPVEYPVDFLKPTLGRAYSAMIVRAVADETIRMLLDIPTKKQLLELKKVRR